MESGKLVLHKLKNPETWTASTASRAEAGELTKIVSACTPYTITPLTIIPPNTMF